MSEQVTPGDVLEIIEALREHSKALKRLAASRSCIGPQNAACRAGLRRRARRNLELADLFNHSGHKILKG